MPRLIHVRETKNLNLYDALRFSHRVDRAALKSGSIRLFGISHLEKPPFSNRRIHPLFAPPNPLPTENHPFSHLDETAVIVNWYARTNIGESSALTEWLHSARADLVVGDGCGRGLVKLSWSLSDLIRRQEGDRIGGDPQPEVDLDDLANQLLMALDPEIAMPWEDLCNTTKERCRRMAAAALRYFNHRVVIVPVRTQAYVEITADPRATAKLMECIPKDIAPEPMLWVHLEGLSHRDS